jgi:hypothetical protein
MKAPPLSRRAHEAREVSIENAAIPWLSELYPIYVEHVRRER